MRIILFTGKGGVGKTTLSAATALHAARKGIKTLVLSTDPAHSLSDALDRELKPEPQEVAPNLFAQEFDVYYSMKKHWESVRQLMLSVFKFQGVKNVVAEELSALPGMEEASAFLWLEEYYRKKEYELVVIDSAPTGETLSLLSLPQVTQSWVMKAFPGQRFAMKGFGAMVRTMTGIPLDKGMEELETLFDKLERIQQVMQDPEVCSIRIVVNPERMVIKEAKRAYSYLQLYGYNVDGVIVNRIFPEEAGKGVFRKYVASQQQYLQEIRDSFEPLPIFEVEHQGQEVFGMELLSRIGQSVYKDTDPAAILYQDNPFEIREEGEGYLARIKLPFVEEGEVTLKKFGDELVISLGNQRRSIFLPRFANYLRLENYEFHAPWLEIHLAR
ncbi:MAG: ArsA family ATPase [Phaeodactylibacter sp.]|nr:ArsA family ATPase [Phaeodactylibacter sp.]MCB9265947.1 ArsA family ATPase [Lewinellaceae bacterium]MCB9289697.1 ArsA family ATPase [Lewinellaceae bacterium]